LNLNNFKNIIETQCKNKDVQLSLVPSYYTSQRCSCCGYIDRDNRLTQENFECLECGYQNNADLNAALNIKFYKDSNVLSSKLLKSDDNWFIPKLSNSYKIKEILIDYYDSL